jgi:eukaryotic-like serine/threonine-protein kinase
MNAPPRIGRYQILRRLGKSMSEVFLALDTEQNRKAALKLVPCAGDAATQLVIEAERRGAAIQSELRHLDPRVVEIYEYGEADGYFFVAMQYVEGSSLADILSADRVVDPCRAAIIALEICEQLAKFHSWESTVVHGDIKPSNIHLGHSDTVRLLDFGIAKTLRADCSATEHNFGSPSYCSPERLARAEVDPQSDLWALGATLYEMLAGVPPFQAEDTQRLESLIRSKRPPRSLPASCPAGLRAIVSKALAPEPHRRYASAQTFQRDLQSFLEGKPTAAEAEHRPKWNPTATLEAARKALRKFATTAARRPRRRLQVMGAMVYFATGMVLWIAGTLAWQGWQARANTAAASPPSKPSPPENLATSYLAAANRILDSYLSSSEPWLYGFDWQKAEICFQRAIELGGADDRTLARLALSRGYATLDRLNGGQYSDKAAAQLRIKARDDFMLSAHKLPNDPAPHLALARVYVYSLPSPEKAMEEFAIAEHLGAVLGRREVQQQGDVYRIRAQQLLRTEWKQAVRDAAVARAYYRRIPGFDEADEHLRELDRIHAPAPKPRPRRYFGWP